MNRSVSFSQFIKNDKNFQSGSPDVKLQNIFLLFDNNDEGILRKHEVRQIVFTLFLIKRKEVKVKESYILEECEKKHKFSTIEVTTSKLLYNLCLYLYLKYMYNYNIYIFQAIEDIVGLVMKTKMNSNFDYINMDNFVDNFLAIPQLADLLK